MRVPRLAARALVLAALVGPALPGIATTSVVSGVTVRTVTVIQAIAPGTPTRVAVALRRHDRLVGVTWATGDPRVTVRWHSVKGWTTWSALESDAGVPNAAERAATRAGTEPAWLPAGADRAVVSVNVRSGAVSGLRLVVVGDAVHRALAGVLTSNPSAEAATGKAALGHVYSRHDWGADESMRNCGPQYAKSASAVVVHHTAQSNSYAAGDVPHMIRADYAYHVQSRGWCDIGYNLLVDRFGRIWEGRYGGIGRAVIGAHAEGFNTGTVGVAFLGTTDHYAPGSAARAAFERVAVYAGTTWHFDPASTVVLTSGGSPRYAAGKHVRLNRVMGHRDTGQTDCPGAHLYADLSGIRSAAHYDIYAPHFTSEAVTGAPVHAPHPVTIRLGISRTAHWSIVIKDSNGKTIAGVHGTGRVAQMSWDGQRAVPGTSLRVPALQSRFTWWAAASAGRDRARGRSGSFHVSTPYVAL